VLSHLVALAVGLVTGYVLPELLRTKRTRRRLDGAGVAALRRELPAGLLQDMGDAVNDVGEMLEPLATLRLAVGNVCAARSKFYDNRLSESYARLFSAVEALDLTLGSFGWPSACAAQTGEPPRGEEVGARVGPAVQQVQRALRSLWDEVHEWEGR
jgi:hypothetical protein